MFNIFNKSIEWNGTTIELETGKIARQANGSVIVKAGKNVVLCTVTSSKKLKEDIDFFPLSVNYLERYYAAGRYPGGFIKREGKPSERELLVSRLIDRPLRPLFPEGFFHEVNITCKVLSYDSSFPADILAIIGSVAALKVSDVPFTHSLAAVRLGLINDKFVFNPSIKDLEQSALDLVIAGTKDSILMVESASKEITEEKLATAIEVAHKNIQPIITLIETFASSIAKEDYNYSKLDTEEVFQSLKKQFYSNIKNAYEITDALERKQKLDIIYKEALSEHSAKNNFKQHLFDLEYKKLIKLIVRNKILDTNIRTDGRGLKDLREIRCEVGLLPQTHGSALFTRGDTQSLSTVTLGSTQDSQLKDDITGVTSEKFTLHYNFPPYAVGEVGGLRPPGRREIGHGKLALKALLPVLPDETKFPYTVRVVSEITESNGSSSMATVCASTLTLMDAGIPINNLVSGIAMGLVLEKDRCVILSDITAEEDALGDMDFKVAATSNGITVLQMDIKVDGINVATIKRAILQSKEGYTSILSKMKEVIAKPRSYLNHSAPRIKVMKINKDKIRDLIGPGGKNIKDICEKTGVKIDVEDSGSIKVFASDQNALDYSLGIIKEVVATPENGTIYSAKVTKVMQFGVFAQFLGNKEGLVHISEISDKNIQNLEEILYKGMSINVKYIGTDHRGKVKLSMKDIKQGSMFTEQESWKKHLSSTTNKQGVEKRDNKEKGAIRNKAISKGCAKNDSNKKISQHIDNKSIKKVDGRPALVGAKNFIKRFFNS